MPPRRPGRTLAYTIGVESRRREQFRLTPGEAEYIEQCYARAERDRLACLDPADRERALAFDA